MSDAAKADRDSISRAVFAANSGRAEDETLWADGALALSARDPRLFSLVLVAEVNAIFACDDGFGIRHESLAAIWAELRGALNFGLALGAATHLSLF